jgi:hypothetical protein
MIHTHNFEDIQNRNLLFQHPAISMNQQRNMIIIISNSKVSTIIIPHMGFSLCMGKLGFNKYIILQTVEKSSRTYQI